jgi:hypothetical protein
MMTNPKNLPWFPLFTAAWLGSDTLDVMTMTERGIYITLLVINWQYGDITWESKTLARKLNIDKRTIQNFMEKYRSLVVTCSEDTGNIGPKFPEGSIHVTFPKLQEFAERLGKTKFEKHRGDETDETKQNNTVRVCGVLKQEQKPQPTASTFDPLGFKDSVTSKSGTVYPAEQVSRILQYHFVYNSNKYWVDPAQGNVTSVARLVKVIDTMAGQVPSDWILPPPQKVLTRFIYDLDCPLCRGTGEKRVPKPEGVGFMDAPCDCPQQKQTLNRETNQWENL